MNAFVRVVGASSQTSRRRKHYLFYVLWSLAKVSEGLRFFSDMPIHEGEPFFLLTFNQTDRNVNFRHIGSRDNQRAFDGSGRRLGRAEIHRNSFLLLGEEIEVIVVVHHHVWLAGRVLPSYFRNQLLVDLVNGRTDGLKLSLKLYHGNELQLAYQQLITEAPRREYLDRTLFWTSGDLENKLLDFRTYFNAHRVHTYREGRTPDTPVSRPLVNLQSHRWQRHCRGLYQTPIAA
jgi:hypothetical protein